MSFHVCNFILFCALSSLIPCCNYVSWIDPQERITVSRSIIYYTTNVTPGVRARGPDCYGCLSRPIVLNWFWQDTGTFWSLNMTLDHLQITGIIYALCIAPSCLWVFGIQNIYQSSPRKKKKLWNFVIENVNGGKFLRWIIHFCKFLYFE